MTYRLICLTALTLSSLAAEETKKEALSFEKDIKPILREKCSHCHNKKTLPEKVSFESADLAFTRTAEGQSIIVPEKPEESLLIVALESDPMHEKAMPMVGKRPTEAEMETLKQWIREGAPWPEGPAGRIVPPFYARE